MILYFCFYFAFNATKICQRCVKIPGWHENKLLYQKESCWSRESACAIEKEVDRERETESERKRPNTPPTACFKKYAVFSSLALFFVKILLFVPHTKATDRMRFAICCKERKKRIACARTETQQSQQNNRKDQMWHMKANAWRKTRILKSDKTHIQPNSSRAIFAVLLQMH